MKSEGARKIGVAFADKHLLDAYSGLKLGRFEDEALASSIDGAIRELKKNPLCGRKIKSSLWPQPYLQKYSITNLFKLDLPRGWRLIYTIKGDEIEILSVILEWMRHKEYERRFGYKKK
jgi:Txe/YoeB family toxin of Txe-Axe toxin-antitoxin module